MLLILSRYNCLNWSCFAQVLYFVGFGLFCLETVLSIWVLQVWFSKFLISLSRNKICLERQKLFCFLGDRNEKLAKVHTFLWFPLSTTMYWNAPKKCQNSLKNFCMHHVCVWFLLLFLMDFIMQQVYMYFRGSGKAAQMKREAARGVMRAGAGLWYSAPDV